MLNIARNETFSRFFNYFNKGVFNMSLDKTLPASTHTPHGFTPVAESPKIVQAYYDILSKKIPSLYDAAVFQIDQIIYLQDHYKSKHAESFYIQRSIHNLNLSTHHYQESIKKIDLALHEQADNPQISRTYMVAQLIHETLGISLVNALEPSENWKRSMGGFKLIVMELESTLDKFNEYLVKTEKREASCKCTIL